MLIGSLLFLALAGLVSCTVFLVLVLVSAIRFYRRSGKQDSPVSLLPFVSVLKPVCGLETNLQANLESFFHQDYPDFEIVFGAREASDPALAIVSLLQQRHPNVAVKIVLSGEPDQPNAKVCSLEKMTAVARADYLVSATVTCT